MSGIDSIRRRVFRGTIRARTKAAYTETDREHRDREAQEADAIVERLIRAHEHGRGIFHGGECCKQGELTANASGTTRVPCGRRPCMCDTTVPCWSQ